jgi:formate dehydrogenase subunit delta
MKIERLIDMANEISSFFEAEAEREEAMADIASHLKRFWHPRMRKQLVDYVQSTNGKGLSSIALHTVRAYKKSLCAPGETIFADQRWAGLPGSSDAG